MNTNIEQQIIETIRIMPEDKQLEALAYLKQKVEDEKPGKRKFLEKIEEIMSEIPKEVYAQYPTDGSLNHDHYLYGSQKRND